MNTTPRRQAAARGLDWRFEWQRFAIRSHPQKPNVIATAAALAMRAHNADLTIRLSAETIGAEVGKQANHIEAAHAVLVRGGFLTWTGRWVDGMKLWWLTTPAVDLSDRVAVAAERRLSDRRGSLGEDEALPPEVGGSHDEALPSDPGSTSPRLDSDFPQTRGALPPEVGGRTGEVPASPTGESVPTSVDRRARERDASGPLGAAYGDAPLEPRTSDEGGDPIGAAVIGYGAADDPQETTTEADEPMECWYCGAMNDAPVCFDCDPDTEAALAEPHGEAHGASASADLPAPAAALLAALEAHSPLPVARVREMLEAQGATLARAMAPLEDVGLAYTAVGPKGLAVHLGSRTPAPVAPVGDPGYVVDPDNDYDDPSF